MSDAVTEPQGDQEQEFLDALGKHITRFVGPVTNIFRELAGEHVQIDIMVVEPTEERNHFTLITCGMSDLPMRIPIEDPEDLGIVPQLRFAELLVCLPPDWPIRDERLMLPEYFWPIRWLKRLARLPHEYQSWLGNGHTIPNGDPPQPIAPGVGFGGWLIHSPLSFHEEFNTLSIHKKIINFYTITPLYPAEMEIKLKKGMAGLNPLLDQANVTEVIDVSRKSVAEAQ